MHMSQCVQDADMHKRQVNRLFEESLDALWHMTRSMENLFEGFMQC